MRVLYVSGSGRSGSTLVERLLHAGGVGCAVGELHCLWRLPADAQTCACGSAAHDDPFWSEVRAAAGFTSQELAELARIEAGSVRSGLLLRTGFDLDRLKRLPQVQRFLSLQFRLYEGIARVSGRDVIVDSSKAGPRAWILACDERVRFLHLWRDPEDVIASWRSRKFDAGLGGDMQRLSVRAAAADWAKVEVLMRRLAGRRAVAMLAYRDLCLAPGRALGTALSRLDLPAIDDAAWLANDRMVPVRDYHSLNGNPDRFGRAPIEVSLRRTDWSRLPAGERTRIRLVGKSLAAVWGAPALS